MDVGFSVVVVFLSLIMWKWGKGGGASSGGVTVKTVYMWKPTWPPHAGWPSRQTSWMSHCGGAARLLGWDVLGTVVYRCVVPILHAWLFHRPVHWSHCGGTLWVVTARKVKECSKWRMERFPFGFSAELKSFWNTSSSPFAGNGGCFWIFLHAGVNTSVPVLRLANLKPLF